MIWHWPQIAWAVGTGVVLLLSALLNGEPRTGKYNFGIVLLSTLFMAFVLWSGGFWAGATP